MANYDPTTELAEILAPKNSRAQPRPELGFHQGLVESWDSSTGENTIRIAGSSITDVPMLNIGDTTNIIEGNTVAVLRYRNAYFIVGRVVVPNTEVFATSAVSFTRIHDNTQNFTITTSDATVQSLDITVPIWSNQALVFVNHNLVAANTTATRKLIYTSVWIQAMGVASSQNTDILLETGAGLTTTLATATASISAVGTVTPGATLTIEGRGMCFPSDIAASLGNQSHLDGFAIFTKVQET